MLHLSQTTTNAMTTATATVVYVPDTSAGTVLGPIFFGSVVPGLSGQKQIKYILS